MSIESIDWGRLDGKTVTLYTLKAGDLLMKVTNYGGIITELHAPGRAGVADIVLGFDRLDGYIAGHPYMGAIAGRCANRIAGGRFDFEGRPIQLARNHSNRDHLHGGVKGFDKYVWDAFATTTDDGVALQLTRTSPDGEENYPGELRTAVVYTLTRDHALRVDITATAKAPTICNIVQHTYWNLAGHASGDIRRHEMTLHADRYTPVDSNLIPTGQILPVARTPYDFLKPKAIGRDLIHVGDAPRGYDTNFVLQGEPGTLRPAALVREPDSGRTLELLTDQPGVQVYTGNFLDATLTGKGGALYRQYQGLCLETQLFPDAVHHPSFPSVALHPGQTYRHTMLHRFAVA